MSKVNDAKVISKLLVNIFRANSRDAVEGEIPLEPEEIARKNDYIEDPQVLADVIESGVDTDKLVSETLDKIESLADDNDDENDERPEPEQPGGTV